MSETRSAGSRSARVVTRALAFDGGRMLRQLDDDLWVVDHPGFGMAGIPIGTRTTLVRLTDGGVFMHAPGPLTVSLAKQIDEIGPVRFIVAPNAFHHLFVAENARAWQDASVHLAPGLAAKRKDLSYNAELGDEPAPGWAADLDQCWMRGSPRVNEVVFLHRSTRTLLLTDLAFNVQHAASLSGRVFFRLTGVYGRFATSRLMRLMVRDRVAARAAAERILGWDFDRVIVTHGDVLERGGHDALRNALGALVGS